MEIETKRLQIRALRDEDAPTIVLGLNNYNVAKNLARVPYPYTLDHAVYFINLQRSFSSNSMICAITFKCAPDELIGFVGYESSGADGKIEFGYWLRECCWHMGLMTEAATALVHYFFAHTDFTKLHSGYHKDNPSSGRILRKLGFRETHEEMNFSEAQGKDVPVVKMQLTRETWQP